MNQEVLNLTPGELEERLSEKQQAFDKAKAEGSSHSELNTLYKEIKEIQHQLSYKRLEKIHAKPW